MYCCAKICFTSCEQIVWIVIIVIYCTHFWHLLWRQTAWSKPDGTTQSSVIPHNAPDFPDWHPLWIQTACGGSKSVWTTQSSVTSHHAPGCPLWHIFSWQTPCGGSKSVMTIQSEDWPQNAPGCPLWHVFAEAPSTAPSLRHTPCFILAYITKKITELKLTSLQS